MSILSSLRYHLGLMRAFGWPAAVSIGMRRRLGFQKPVALRWRGQSILVRPRESDPIVASAILGWDEYGLGARAEAALSQLATRWRQTGCTPVIVDGGANVGYAALYFARRFPDAAIFAIEPNPETFAMLQRNCTGYPQIQTIHGALWSHSEGVSLWSKPGESWADRVNDGGDTPSLRLQDLMRTVPSAKPLIVKLDIEGAEREVCQASPDVLRSAACILIEPHDYLRPGSSCLSPLYDAMKGCEVDTLLVGEYIALIQSDLLKDAAQAQQTPLEEAAIIARVPTQHASAHAPQLTGS